MFKRFERGIIGVKCSFHRGNSFAHLADKSTVWIYSGCRLNDRGLNWVVTGGDWPSKSVYVAHSKMSRSVFSYNCLHIDLSLDCVAPSTFASPIKCAAGLSCSEFKVTASIKLRLWVNCCLWRHVSNELVVLFGSVRFSFCTDFK